jgi:SAM-dependent methyltransferase
MGATIVEKCGLCGGTSLGEVLDVGSSPLTCNMAHVGTRAVETHYPLVLLRCRDCTLVQLSVVPDPSLVFPADYPYSSGNSRALHENFEDLARQVEPYATDLIVDIGANDGTLLSKFDGCYRVGVEPTAQWQKADVDAMWSTFFSEEVAHEIVQHHDQANVVMACNVLAHVHDIHDVMRGINVLLADDGILVTENHDLASVVYGGQWDTVYHEHLRFYDPYSFDRLLAEHGLRPVLLEPILTHGGSFRMMAQKRSEAKVHFDPREYDWMALRMRAIEDRDYIRAQAREVAGIGATARATTIINYCGLDVEDVAYVAEVSGSDKIGRYVPGTRIPIVDEQRLFEEQRPAILFSWHMADIIGPKLRERGYRGEMILPLQPA